MFVSVTLITIGILVLVAGGELLLRGAVGIANEFKLSPAVIGLTVVAAGTSVPELAVSGVASLTGKTDIAVANVVGSNIFNITVIVGLCALINPIPILGNTIKLEYPVLALVTFLCVLFCRDAQLDRLEAAMFLASYVGFTAYLVGTVKPQVNQQEESAFSAEVEQLTAKPILSGVAGLWLLLGVGVGLLMLGAHLTVKGASDLARLWGWSERVIGLTIVSAGTGLPEVVASVMSAIRGRVDIAIGNVIGSNLFNILAILGLSGVIAPISVQADILSDCWWMLGVTVLLFPLMRSDMKVTRLEGGALFVIYASYLYTLL